MMEIDNLTILGALMAPTMIKLIEKQDEQGKKPDRNKKHQYRLVYCLICQN